MELQEILSKKKESTKERKISVSVNNKYLNNTNNTNPTNHSVTDVRTIAAKLVDRLNNPSRFKFYCKVAWRLPEAKIWNNLEAALNGQQPQRLFSWLCAQDLK